MREHSNALQNLAMPEEASINVYNEPPVVPLAVDAHEVEEKFPKEKIYIFHRFCTKSHQNPQFCIKILSFQISIRIKIQIKI